MVVLSMVISSLTGEVQGGGVVFCQDVYCVLGVTPRILRFRPFWTSWDNHNDMLVN